MSWNLRYVGWEFYLASILFGLYMGKIDERYRAKHPGPRGKKNE